VEKAERMQPDTHPRNSVIVDPLPDLVDNRFRLLSECRTRGDQCDPRAVERRADEVRLLTRRLDERIVRTVAVSAPGLLAQLRLLAAFYAESLNGSGRRGSLLIQTIAAGIARLEADDFIGRSGTVGARSYPREAECDLRSQESALKTPH
jgi:hypothetical protein